MAAFFERGRTSLLGGVEVGNPLRKEALELGKKVENKIGQKELWKQKKNLIEGKKELAAIIGVLQDGKSDVGVDGGLRGGAVSDGEHLLHLALVLNGYVPTDRR